METKGCIYILTNPSFESYVKIGYADDVNKRLKELNRSECVPFSFRLYAYYKVPKKLTDLALHRIIDKLNPDLRSIETTVEGKQRKREFYAMTPEDAYGILEGIAQIHGLENNLVLVEKTNKDIMEEKMAKELSDYSEETHVNNHPKMKDLYELLKSKIVELGDVTIEAKKCYIAYKRNKNFCDIVLWHNKLVIFINKSKGTLNDPENRCEDVSVKGHWGNGDYAITINSVEEVDYVISLIKQSYDNN